MPVVRNLLTGLHKPPKGERQFRYLGSYRVERVEPLSQTEWSLLPMEVGPPLRLVDCPSLIIP